MFFYLIGPKKQIQLARDGGQVMFQQLCGIYKNTYIYICIYICIYIYICIRYTYTCVKMCAYIYIICVYICVRVCIYMKPMEASTIWVLATLRFYCRYFVFWLVYSCFSGTCWPRSIQQWQPLVRFLTHVLCFYMFPCAGKIRRNLNTM